MLHVKISQVGGMAYPAVTYQGCPSIPWYIYIIDLVCTSVPWYIQVMDQVY